MSPAAFPALRPLLSAAIHRGLGGRFSREELERIARATLDDYEQERHCLPDERGGARIMIHLAALSAGLYRALCARVDEPEARRQVADVTWRVFRSFMALPTAMAALGARSVPERLRRATDLVRRYPMGAPGYQVVDVPDAGCAVAFDVLHCPVAAYLGSQELPALGVAAFCDLDHRLAAEWGVHLIRAGTLAGGQDRCDFRWHAGDADA